MPVLNELQEEAWTLHADHTIIDTAYTVTLESV